ncbi:unnamed protein product [Phytomonas sp. Hart1]|nr:unnamed protein product [Phytomonas sp. Hart1]|eukprot:CCW66724.1 unnamed protein product [Phytomonas sp. isolate Hart1]
MAAASARASDEELGETKLTADHGFHRIKQEVVFPLVYCRAVSDKEYVAGYYLGNNNDAVIGLVDLFWVVHTIVAYPHFTNCKNEAINIQCGTVDIIEIIKDGHVNIDMLTLSFLSSSTRGSPSGDAEWKVEAYTTALGYSRHFNFCLKGKEYIVIFFTESDDDVVCPRQTQSYFLAKWFKIK